MIPELIRPLIYVVVDPHPPAGVKPPVDLCVDLDAVKVLPAFGHRVLGIVVVDVRDHLLVVAHLERAAAAACLVVRNPTAQAR